MIWKLHKLGEVTLIINGYSFKSGDFSTENETKTIKITNVGVQDFIEETDSYLPIAYKNQYKNYLVAAGDVVIALTRTIISSGLKVAIVPETYEKALLNQRVAAIKVNQSILDKSFLYFYLASQYAYDYVKGSVNELMQPNLSIKDLKGFSIPLPPINEQKRIVAILDQAFADIEKARANAEQNLKNARELFESYLQQVFSQRGDGWKVSKLINIAKVVDSLHKTPKYSDEGYPMVRVTDVRSGALDLSNTKKVDKATYNEFSQKYKAQIGDIVFSRVGSYGRSSIVTTDKPFCLGQNTVFLAPSIDGYYFYYFLNSQYARDQVDKLVAGTTQPTVSLKSIKSIEVPVPSEREQVSIVKKLDEMHKKVLEVESIYQQKTKNLDELKKSILQKAFTGELTKETAT